MSDLRKQLEEALFALPKPVTADSIIAESIAVLGTDSKEVGEFSRWFDVNGATLLRRING